MDMSAVKSLKLMICATLLVVTVIFILAGCKATFLGTENPSNSTKVTINSEQVNNQVDRTPQSVSDILDIIPVSAKTLEYPDDTTDIESLESFYWWGEEGWKTIYLYVAVGNKTSSFLKSFPEELERVTALEKNKHVFQLVTKDGYSYDGKMAIADVGYTLGPIPPYLYTVNVSGYSFDTYMLNDIRIMFQVPSNITEFSFVYDNQRPIVITELLEGKNISKETMTQKIAAYSDEYTSELNSATFSFKESGTLSINEINTKNSTLTLSIDIENNGGYNIVFEGSSDFILTVIDDEGYIYRITWNISDKLPPGIVRNYIITHYIPAGYSCIPAYLSVYNVANPQESVVYKLDKTNINQRNAYESERIFSAENIKDFYVANDTLYIIDDSNNVTIYDTNTQALINSFELPGKAIGLVNGYIICVSGSRSSSPYHICLVSQTGDYVMTEASEDFRNYLDNYGRYFSTDCYHKVTYTNLLTNEHKEYYLEYSDVDKEQYGSCLPDCISADSNYIYLPGEEYLTIINIDNGQETNLKYAIKNPVNSILITPNYLLLSSINSPVIYDRISLESLDIPFMGGSNNIIINDTICSLVDSKIVLFDIQSKSYTTLYIQEDLSDTYYYGIIKPIRLDLGYIYFLYKDTDDTFSIHRVPNT